jgi:hypothetical protein
MDILIYVYIYISLSLFDTLVHIPFLLVFDEYTCSFVAIALAATAVLLQAVPMLQVPDFFSWSRCVFGCARLGKGLRWYLETCFLRVLVLVREITGEHGCPTKALHKPYIDLT